MFGSLVPLAAALAAAVWEVVATTAHTNEVALRRAVTSTVRGHTLRADFGGEGGGGHRQGVGSWGWRARPDGRSVMQLLDFFRRYEECVFVCGMYATLRGFGVGCYGTSFAADCIIGLQGVALQLAVCGRESVSPGCAACRIVVVWPRGVHAREVLRATQCGVFSTNSNPCYYCIRRERHMEARERRLPGPSAPCVCWLYMLLSAYLCVQFSMLNPTPSEPIVVQQRPPEALPVARGQVMLLCCMAHAHAAAPELSNTTTPTTTQYYLLSTRSNYSIASPGGVLLVYLQVHKCVCVCACLCVFQLQSGLVSAITRFAVAGGDTPGHVVLGVCWVSASFTVCCPHRHCVHECCWCCFTELLMVLLARAFCFRCCCIASLLAQVLCRSACVRVR